VIIVRVIVVSDSIQSIFFILLMV